MNYKTWSLKHKNVGIFSFLIFVVFFSGAVIFYSLHKSEEDTDIIAALGRQRMLSQTMGKSALGYAMAVGREKILTQQIEYLNQYITQVRAIYTQDVIVNAKKAHLRISMNPESERHPSIPFPATLTRMVNERFGSDQNLAIDIISDNPINQTKKLKTELDKEAFSHLKKSPDDTFHKTYEDKDKLYIAFYTADVASVEACASCHSAMKGRAYKLGEILGIRKYNMVFSDDVALGQAELKATMTEYETAKSVFEKTLTAIKSGGEFPLNIGMTEFKTIRAVANDTIQKQIKDIEIKMEEVGLMVQLLLNEEVGSLLYRTAQQKILVETNNLRDLSDKLVVSYKNIADENQRNIRWAVVLSGLFTFIILLGVMSFMSSSIIRPITGLSKVLSKMAQGNFKQEKLDVSSHDEIGTLSETYNIMLDTMRDVVNQAEDIAAGNLTKQYKLEGDLAVAFRKMTGELSEKQQADRKFKEMAEERRVHAEDLKQKVDHILRVVSAAAKGDLTQEVLVAGEDAIGQMGAGLTVFFKNLTDNITSILQAANSLARSANEISGAVQDQASVLQQQSASVTEISATVEELSLSSSQVAGNASNVADFSGNVLHESEKGMETLGLLKAKMDEITEGNNANIAEIVALGKKSNEIGKIMEIINNIADQTKLIAFNAAIEAASAGEAGKRFNVVAVEIRRLADSVMKSTDDIQKKIEEIQQAVSRLVITSETGSKKIHEGTSLTGQTIADLESLVMGAKSTADAVTQISLATRQQKTATDQVLAALKEIEKGSRQSSAAVKQTSTVTTQLSEMSNGLKNMLGKFKIES